MERLQQLMDLIDEVNAVDPHKIQIGGKDLPRQWFDSQRLTRWVTTLNPGASEALRIAGHGQHIARWTVPRTDYPMDRGGYLRWREDLKKIHAAKVAELMAQVGYPPETIEEVRQIILKKNIKGHPDTQTLEDALCLAFLEDEFAEFRLRVDEAKMIGVLQKTWRKMSDQGHTFALQLPMGETEKKLIQQALH